MNWLEVSLVVNGELAEAVADVLARFAYSGVMMEQGVKYVDDEDAGTPTGPITVRAYLEMDDQIEETRQKLEESLYYLGMIQPLPAATYKQVADQNWMEAWKQHYKPILIGGATRHRPGLDGVTRPGPHRDQDRSRHGVRHRDTSHHPAVPGIDGEICSSNVIDPIDIHVIDVGCGSGSYRSRPSSSARKTALGVDIDAGSVKNARENADANGVGEELILGVGSVDEIKGWTVCFRKAPLVVANILAPVIVRLFDAGLAGLIEEDGAIILSGILQEQEERVIEAGQATGLEMNERRQMGDWVALTMSRYQSPKFTMNLLSNSSNKMLKLRLHFHQRRMT
jgi:ribosomal protein L11 methyltransferase